MSDILFGFLSILGIGQSAAHASSTKRGEAMSLNAEFEMSLNRMKQMLSFERTRLHQRVEKLSGELTDIETLHASIEAAIDGFLA
ncbi:MAG: hypothetical protein AAF708_21080 [Deinococcota bacterium]